MDLEVQLYNSLCSTAGICMVMQIIVSKHTSCKLHCLLSPQVLPHKERKMDS